VAVSRIFIHGVGAVSPAGWGARVLFDAVREKRALPTKELERPGWSAPLLVRGVPAGSQPPAIKTHPRLRRTSPITHYGVGAALEALDAAADNVRAGTLKLGIVFCVMTGCVNYSRRFYDEALHDPAMASPLIFPETVFNAPSSHLAAVLQTQEINYTLVGDPGTFLQGLALAADWLGNEQVDGCLVIGAEELEWLVADAYRLTAPSAVLAEGAGALYLSRQEPLGPGVELNTVTDAHCFFCEKSRAAAAEKVRSELPTADLLCDGLQGVLKLDAAEEEAWADWAGCRLSPKKILGEGLMAAAAWQCVVAVEALKRGLRNRANISVVGCNQQAIGTSFAERSEKH
jgi:3-oxoacyl-(acyl-carrier-protein) synthase